MVLRKCWFSDLEILKQNTSCADFLLVEGNPLEDVSLMADWKNNLKLIVKDGKVFKNSL